MGNIDYERFRKFIKAEYNELRSRAEQKTICSYNNGNMPKRKLIESFKQSTDYSERLSNFEKKVGATKYADMLDSEELLRKSADSGEYDKAYKIYCRIHETPEERQQRIDEEERLESELEEYLEDYDYDEESDIAAEEIASEMIRKIEGALFNKKPYVDRYPLCHYGRYDYSEEVEVDEDNIDEYINSILNTSEDAIDDSYIEDITDLNWLNSGVTELMIEHDAFLSKVNESDIFLDDFYEMCAEEEVEQKPFYIVIDYFTKEKVLELLNKNPYIKDILDKKKKYEERMLEIGNDILSRIPDKAIDLFPAARRMKREFVLHIGPTNSGKTYSAIEEMKEVGSGVYLGPLRLLAFEQYENLNLSGYPCSMITGEEKCIVEGSDFTASTIEMADFHKLHKFAVVDEAQMVCDKSRGGAWTSVILGLPCEKIAVCLAPEAEQIIIHLIEMCGDKYSIVRHERKVPLVVENDRFQFPKDVQDGDALIVFSRKNVHAIAAELQSRKINCSVIYGALPYDVRHEQARKFASGETKVVVATDAIGMGMNLPIKRVVFLEVSKFDGVQRHLLSPGEIKQIAGRAGRYGKYDIGYVNTENEKEKIKKAINGTLAQIKKPILSFPESLIGINGNLSEIIEQWISLEDKEGFGKSNMTDKLELCKFAEEFTDNKKLIYDLISLPFDSKNIEVRCIWEALVRAQSEGISPNVEGMIPKVHNITYDADNMGDLETAHKVCDLLYAFCDKFGLDSYVEEILKTKSEISKKILQVLETQKLQGRKCKYCGRLLKWNYPYGMCSKCHDEMYPKYNDYDYF